MVKKEKTSKKIKKNCYKKITKMKKTTPIENANFRRFLMQMKIYKKVTTM